MKRILWSITALCVCVFSLAASQTAAAETAHTNSIGMGFVLVPAGSFNMGEDKKFEDASDYESPVHKVTVSQPFYLGKFEVTQAQWVLIMGNNPSYFKSHSNPVDQVSWYDVQEFIRRLNQKEGHDRYRLPTEAEWEYAARAGTESTYSFGNDAARLGRYAWYEDNSTHPVGQKEPNPWGLYDIHGNVCEWVQDWYGKYSQNADTDPKGPSSGSNRVFRGGSWRDSARDCRSASRNDFTPDLRLTYLGFRLALSPDR